MASSTITRRTDVSASHGDPYVFNVEGFRSGVYRVNTPSLRIAWAVEDAVPEHVKQDLAESCHGVITNTNGACALHAVFGQPNVAQEMFARGARDIAAYYLSALPEPPTRMKRFSFCGKSYRPVCGANSCDLILPIVAR